MEDKKLEDKPKSKPTKPEEPETKQTDKLKPIPTKVDDSKPVKPTEVEAMEVQKKIFTKLLFYTAHLCLRSDHFAIYLYSMITHHISEKLFKTQLYAIIL